jgi:hypothetical protein
LQLQKKNALFSRFFTVFRPLNKAKPVLNALYIGMRSLRILAASVWYFVSTAVNNAVDQADVRGAVQRA